MAEYTLPTKAIITYTPSDWRLQPVLSRAPGPGELLVKLTATSICHTDIVNAGSIAPRILGHEGAGHVIRKGPDVSIDVSVGDPVLLSFAHCGECNLCVTGHPAHCRHAGPLTILAQEPNFALGDGEPDDERLEVDATGRRRVLKAGYFGHSSFCHVALVKESSVVNVKGLIRDDEELKVFAPLGCGIQTGTGAVVNVAKPGPDDAIAVFGLGGVGLSAIMAAKAIGLKTIIAVDILPNRLELATELGATHTINSRDLSKEDLATAVRSLDPFNPAKAGPAAPFGPSAIIDTTGVSSLLQAALAAVNRMGRVVQLANQGPGSNVPVDLQSHMTSGVHLTGTIQGDSVATRSIPMLIQWYREGKLPLEKLEKRYPVEEFEQARKEMHEGSVIKPVLIW